MSNPDTAFTELNSHPEIRIGESLEGWSAMKLEAKGDR